MKDFDLEMKGIAMEGGPDDYDEYEEEVVDRDEEYDDEEGEYDDEDYGDEDYGDEDYDDGYDDNYYDERLNKVLDELAELKRTMANPPAVQNQSNFTQPSIPYVYAGNIPQNQGANSGGEVVMYNEISRLRDELSKTQSSQNLHVELNRLKEEMERDRKFNESQYLSEIKRLNEKIETLQKNSLSPQSEDNAYLPESYASEGRAIDSDSFNKLIAINESILQNSKSNDSRVQAELADIKKRLSALDTEEINRSVSSIKKLAKGGMNAEDMSAIAGEISSLRQLLPAGGSGAAPSDASLMCSLEELKAAAGEGGDNIALLKKLYEINRSIGYADEDESSEREELLGLINEFLAIKAASLEKQSSLGDTLRGVTEFASKLSSLNSCDALPLVDACNGLITEALRAPLDKKNAEELVRFADETATLSVSREKRDNLDKFVVLAQRIVKCEPSEAVEILPELLEAKSKLQDGVRQGADNVTAENIRLAVNAGADVSDPAFKELTAKVAELRVGDVVKYPKVTLSVSAGEEVKPIVSLADKLDGIINMLAGGGFKAAAGVSSSGTGLNEVRDEIAKLCSVKQLDDALSELKTQYVKILNSLSSVSTAGDGVAAVNAETGEAQYSNNELSDQLYNVRDELTKALHEENILTQDTVELKLTDFSEAQAESRGQLADDLEFIKTKLTDAEELIGQISDIRSDILSIPTLIDVEPNFSKLYEDLCAQFDKLYEDVSALLSAAENNVVDRVNESMGATMDNVNAIIDSINANIDNINAVVSGVNTSLDGINSNFEITNENINNVNNALNDNLLTISATLDEVRENVVGLATAEGVAPIADAVADLRAAIDDFVIKAAANDDAALTDRLKLLDDISFLRQQVENSQMDETAEQEETLTEQQTIYRELEDTKEKITQDLLVLSDSITNLNIDELRDNVTIIKDTLDILATDNSTGVISEDIALLKESNQSLLDTLSNNAEAEQDFRAAVQEDIAFIRSRLETENQEQAETDGEEVTVNDIYASLIGVSDKLTAIESAGADDTQTLAAYLEDIKEQLHLKELEPSIEGLTGSEEEKQSLLNEIAEVRERLSSVEQLSKEQSDSALLQLSVITDELNLLKEAVENAGGSSSSDLVLAVSDLSEKINEIAETGNDSAAQLGNLTLIAEDITQIKETLDLSAAADGAATADTLSEMVQTVNDMSDRVKDFAERMELVSVDMESLPLVLSEIGELKAKIEGGPDVELGSLEELSAKIDDALVKLDAASSDLDSISLLTVDVAEIKERLNSIGVAGSSNLSEGVTNSDEIAEQLSILSDRTNEIIERSESGGISDETLQTITTEIEDVKQRLTSDYEKIQEDISFIRNQIELNVDSDDDVSVDGGEELNAIMDDLSVIKEKLVATDEYDVMAEILSLREDVKASRLTDQSEVTAEMENVKSEFSEQSAAIIDEIRTLKADLTALSSAENAGQPTNDEINMVLSEIVSLRDEIQSYKDELNGFMETVAEEKESGDDETAAAAETNESMTVILDELTSMRSELTGFKEETQEKQAQELEPMQAELTALQDGIAELKDMIIRRTTLNPETAESEGEGEKVVSASGLDVVLNELINLKDDFETVRSQMSAEIDSVKELVAAEQEQEPDWTQKLDSLEEAVTGIGAQLSDLQLSAMTGEPEQSYENGYERVLEAIEELKQSAVNNEEESGENLDVLSEILLLHEEINDVKNSLARDVSGDVAVVDYSAVSEEIRALREQVESVSRPVDLSEITEQISQLKEEWAKSSVTSGEETDSGVAAQLKEIRELLLASAPTSQTEEIQMLRDEIVGLRQEIAANDLGSSEASDVGVTAELMSLREEIVSLKEEMKAAADATLAVSSAEPDLGVMSEIMALRDEIAAMKEQLSLQSKPQTEPDMTLLTEIMALRDEIAELKNGMAAPDAGLVETVEQIREDVRVMKDEPDLSALSEVLALRDEFQAMKDELAGKNDKSGETVKSNEEILSEVQSLRDQLFAISMANVNDGSTDKVTYESYNNIILDEITALREELNAYKAADSTQAIVEEISDIKEQLSSKTVDEKNLFGQLGKLKSDIEALKNSEAKDATNNAILEELSNLKNELTNQREADLTTLNFMSEMAHLIERQNQYINQSANSKITDEIESLKAEIASSLTAPAVETSAIMNEIAKLKEEIAANSEDEIDNQTILDELTKLKDEISKEKPSQQNTIVLEEIARLKSEISALSAKESADNKDVSVQEITQSINDLKNELTQIADMVGEEPEKPKKAPQRTKTGSKKSTARKTQPAKKQPEAKEALSSDELISKIEATSIEIPRSEALDADEFNRNLDFNYAGDRTNPDDMDLASKLAKQVANKLIMEQLVEQLGDGGVPENKVEEIVKDILPQEFSTVQIEEQSDQVRRLANSLVLDKLRSRLTGRKDNKNQD